MTVACGLDQAPSGTGYAFGDGSGPPTRGYQEFDYWGDNTLRLGFQVARWMCDFIEKNKIERICVEQIIATARFHPGQKGPNVNIPVLVKQAAVEGGIIAGCVLAGLDENSLDQATISEWRQEFLELTKAPKNMPHDWLKDRARLQCLKRGWLVDNHHTAEACGIWDWYLAYIDRNYRQRRGPDHRRAMNEWIKEPAA